MTTSAMFRVRGVFQPHRLAEVVRALHALPHFPGFTVQDVRGQGRGRGAGGAFKVVEDEIDYHRKTAIEVVCAGSQTDAVVQAILRGAKTGHAGDGIVIVEPLARVVRIRTGEEGEGAV
ncbi:MAG: P-II family nitrogen regulator [Planctomycetaceae bacterium]|nr:P-II family nitrogen regulator [Planctomycetota bacterium]NUN51194.1 P-II family nitrogen regulator [Planctomycetaceae bacterium]